VESAWLFTRGDQSVRIVRVGQRDGARRLMIHGPGESRVDHEFDDVVTCAIQQSEIERRLVARRFRLSRFVGQEGSGDGPSVIRVGRRAVAAAALAISPELTPSA
jgi:hypothetical protein